MLINNSEFTKFGRAWRNGEFKKLHKASMEYELLWQEQLNHCIHGMTVGGKYMCGALYAYVNFGNIELMDDYNERKKRGLPLLRDVEWEVFDNIERAKKAKKGLLWISGRRGGKSYIASWLLAYNFIFFANSKGVATAGDGDKVNDLMLKVKLHLEGLRGTEFGLPLLRENLEEEFVSGYRVKDENNNWVERCNDRVIYSRNFKQKHTAANGLSSDIFVFEEIGMFDNLKAAYNSSEPCWKEGTTSFGFPFLCGTGGDMEKGSIDAKKMFDDPETYNLLAFADEDTGVKRCFFLPGYMVLNDYKDADGNTRIKEATDALLKIRETLKAGKELDKLLQHIQYYPLSPEEAFLISTGNIFPVELIQQQIERITKSPGLQNLGIRGYMGWDEGKAVFIPNEEAREVDYPVKAGASNIGCVTIYESPEVYNGSVPVNLYVAGTDPYAQDTAETSVSLGSTFIYKRFLHAGVTHDWIVAEYTGRPLTSDEYHEQLRRLLNYYNCRTLYENNIPGLKQYFETKNCLYRLHPQPAHVKDLYTDTAVDRRFGITMTKSLKVYMLNTIRNFLLEEYSDGDKIKYRVEDIYSVPLLKEMLYYNDKDNFDRIVAFGLVLIQNIEDVRLTDIGNEPKSDYFAELFSRVGFTAPGDNTVNNWRTKFFSSW